jgi:hypothetical protein
MGEICWLEPRDLRWAQVVQRSAAHDIYHLAEYHLLAAERGEGEPRLLLYRDGDAFVALPLLLRPVPAALAGGDRMLDACSVYGYPGPLRSPGLPEATGLGFAAAAQEFLAARRVVAVFSRLNPLLGQEPLLAGLGTIQRHGRTVSIDLTLPEAAQLRGYRSNHRRDLRALGADGHRCRIGCGGRDLEAFAAIHAETMRRVGAAAFYELGPEDLGRLHDRLGERVTLVLCEVDGEVAAAGLFLRQGSIVQYHLGGTCDADLSRAPMKLVMDFARAWFHARGATVLHLGGGLGGHEDSLFRFKAGFSDRRHVFCTWRWVVRPDDYARLCHPAGSCDGRAPDDGAYFPAYRCPGARAAAAALQ